MRANKTYLECSNATSSEVGEENREERIERTENSERVQLKVITWQPKMVTTLTTTYRNKNAKQSGLLVIRKKRIERRGGEKRQEYRRKWIGHGKSDDVVVKVVS